MSQSETRLFGAVYIDEFDGLDAFEIAALVALRSFGPTESRFPSHRALAARAGMSVSKVQQALKSLREKDLVLWSQRAPGSTNTYITREEGSVPRTEGVGTTYRGGSVPRTDISREVLNTEENQIKTTHAAACEDPEGGAQMNVGMPDDLEHMDEPPRRPARKKPDMVPPAPDTFKRCEVEFHNRTLAVVGSPQYSAGHLRKVISGLHRGDYGREYSYREIHDAIIPVYFVRNSAYITGRRSEIDVVKHFVSQINTGLLVQASTRIKSAGGASINERVRGGMRALEEEYMRAARS